MLLLTFSTSELIGSMMALVLLLRPPRHLPLLPLCASETENANAIAGA